MGTAGGILFVSFVLLDVALRHRLLLLGGVVHGFSGALDHALKDLQISLADDIVVFNI